MAFPTYLNGNGAIGLILQPGEKTILNRNGIAERTSIFLSEFDPGYPFVPLVTPYPNQSTGGFVTDKCEVEKLPGGFWKTTAVFISLIVPATQYTTYDSKLVQVPIDQSPDFADIAGTPDDPQNGAIFDSNGVFVAFGPGSEYQGVVSAFVITSLMIVRGSGPSVPAIREDIFCESFSSTLRGNVWEYEITYNLSITLEGIVAGAVDGP